MDEPQAVKRPCLEGESTASPKAECAQGQQEGDTGECVPENGEAELHANAINIMDFQLSLSADVEAWLTERMPPDHLQAILKALPLPRRTTSLRVNTLATDRATLIDRIAGPLADGGFTTEPHRLLPDCIVIQQRLKRPHDGSSSGGSGGGSCGDLQQEGDIASDVQPNGDRLMKLKTVLVDKGCGEALLRGADLFAKGVRGLSNQIRVGDKVKIMVVFDDSKPTSKVVPQASNVMRFAGARTVFIGLGVARMTSADIRRASGAPKDVRSGVAVEMQHFDGGAAPSFERLQSLTSTPVENSKPEDSAPEDASTLSGQGARRSQLWFAQNICSLVASHALAPKPGEVVLDMCAAPGGKSSHLAALMENKGVLVCCERGRGKCRRMAAKLADLGITCARVCKIDSGNPVLPADGSAPLSGTPNPNAKPVTLDQVATHDSRLAVAFTSSAAGHVPSKQDRRSKGGGGGDGGGGSLTYYSIPKWHQFAPNTFDRVLLDPPCTALGLRPRLEFDPAETAVVNLEFCPRQQKHFLANAAALCKPGGVIVYSTCTFSPEENERVVAWALKELRSHNLKLVAALPRLGDAGLPGCGLTDEQCRLVQRFSPSSDVLGTAATGLSNDGPGGFFIAKFIKGLEAEE